MRGSEEKHLRFSDVVEVLVDAGFCDVHFHRQRLVVDLGKLANQVATQIKRCSVLLVLRLRGTQKRNQKEKIGETTSEPLRKEHQFVLIAPTNVPLAHIDLFRRGHVHVNGDFDDRFHYV